jgi:hypothetical protein
MSFFYDLNKKLNGIGAEEKKLVESKQAPKTPARQTLEQALRQDLTALMEGQVNEISQSTKDSYAKKAKAEVNIYNRNKNNPAPSPKDKEMSAMSAARREKGLARIAKEDGTGGMNFSGSGSLEEKKGYSAKAARAGKDIGKPGKNFSKIAKGAAERYGSKEAGERVAGAVLNKLRHPNESMTNEGTCPSCNCSPCKCDESVEESALQAYLGNKKYGKEGMDALRKAGREHAGKEKMSKIRAQYDKMDEAEMECDTPTPSKGIPGNIPVPGKMDRLKGKRDYYETDDNEEDIMDYLNRKLAPHDKEQAKEDAISNPYNGSAGDADAYNGLEFEGNAFTGKLKSTPKGGKFELDGKEFTDTSELDEAMTRQHFQHTADLLKHIEDPAKRMELAKHHAGIFKASNPRFDHNKFMKACDLNEYGMEEGNAFTGKLANTPKGGKFELDGKEYTDTSSVDEGWDDMEKWLAQREKEKGTGKFDKRKVSTGTVYTRRFDDEPEDDDTDAPVSKGGKPAVKRGRGRPVGTKGATGSRGPTGKSKLMSKDAIREFEVPVTSKGEYDQEGDEVKGDMHTVIRHASELEKHLKDSENLPTWVIEKIGQIKGMMASVSDYMLTQHERNVEKATGEEGVELDEKAVSKKQQKFMGMVHAAQKGEKAASPEVAKVAKGMTKKAAHDFAATKHKGLPEKVKAKKTEEGAKPDFLDLDKDGDKKESMKKAAKEKIEKKVEETTTSSSVATSSDAPKSSKSGMKFGGGIYDSWNRDVENMINENINLNTTMTKNDTGEDHESLTITVDGDDIGRLKELLQSMGIAQSQEHSYEPHADEPCHSCGGVPCQCDELAEADAPVTQNEPDYPSNQEESDDALQYSGGLNGPKSTGQSTVPVLASQEERQMSESNSFLDLYKAFSKIVK